MTAPSDDLLERIAASQTAGNRVALATVVRTWGSSPRPAGSQLLVNEDGAFVGSVSGGCIEGAVIDEALAVIADGRPRLLEFGVSDERAWEVGLACGGRVQVYVERVGETGHFDRLLAAHRAKRAVALVTRLADGAQSLLDGESAEGDLPLSQATQDEVRGRIAAERSGLLEADEALFARVYVPSPRLLIVGAVHIAQALAPMARLAGFEVTLIDPRRAFASAERFPDAAVTHDWPDEALARLAPDSGTAVVVLSHDPKLDDPALAAALASPAFYIGALGSRRTHAQRLVRLREAGLEVPAGRIRSPVGLDLGGRAPAEIATAILAEIIQCRYASERPVASSEWRGSRGEGLAVEITQAPSTMPRVAALVLAAGASTRMGGQHKLLREVGGVPMVRRAVDAALASRCAQVLVVTGCEAGAIEATLDPERVSICRNPDYANGLSTSLRCGLAALPPDTSAIVVLLADMPRVSAAHIDRIIAAFDPDRPSIVVPTCRGRRGNPVLWPRRLFAELRGIVGDTGARGLLETYADEVISVDIGEGAILDDVDTPADLARLMC